MVNSCRLNVKSPRGLCVTSLLCLDEKQNILSRICTILLDIDIWVMRQFAPFDPLNNVESLWNMVVTTTTKIVQGYGKAIEKYLVQRY